MVEKVVQLKIAETKNLTREEKIKYYTAFSYLDIRPFFKAKLFEYFDFDIKRTFDVTKEELSLFSSSADISIPRDFLKKRDELDIEECFKKAFLDDEVGIVTFEDEKYPPLLKEIPDFPLSLYYKGDIENINYDYNFAVVGSRNASMDAKIALSNILKGFKNTDITIVSGLAFGIDAAAHKSALENNIKTISVVGCGLDIIYPTQNTQLFYEIINKGGVVFSEYPLKTPPLSLHFPQRNRIVVGMSKATLVGEARKKSGAMISANLTLEYNRELMCIPGNILNPNTEGIYYLIKNGAGIVSKTEDILNQMNWKFELNNKKEKFDLSDLHKKVFNSISKEAKTFDEIINDVKLEISQFMVILTELEIKGLIKQSNNKYYKLTD